MHARVAVYRIVTGSADDVARKADAEGGMLTVFRAHAGFQSYELIGAGDTLVSVSRWDTAEQADLATTAARSWVAEHLARVVELRENHIGEVVLSSTAPEAVGL